MTNNSTNTAPEGYHSVTPYLTVDDAVAALAFYKRVFGARERMRMSAPSGRIGHAEIEIGDSCIMLADTFPDMGCRNPRMVGGTPVNLYLYVADVDAVVREALAGGAKELRPVKDQFYGDRTGAIEDPFGHVWHIATRKEDLSADEIERRGEAVMAQGGGCN